MIITIDNKIIKISDNINKMDNMSKLTLSRKLARLYNIKYSYNIYSALINI